MSAIETECSATTETTPSKISTGRRVLTPVVVCGSPCFLPQKTNDSQIISPLLTAAAAAAASNTKSCTPTSAAALPQNNVPTSESEKLTALNHHVLRELKAVRPQATDIESVICPGPVQQFRKAWWAGVRPTTCERTCRHRSKVCDAIQLCNDCTGYYCKWMADLVGIPVLKASGRVDPLIFHKDPLAKLYWERISKVSCCPKTTTKCLMCIRRYQLFTHFLPGNLLFRSLVHQSVMKLHEEGFAVDMGLIRKVTRRHLERIADSMELQLPPEYFSSLQAYDIIVRRGGPLIDVLTNGLSSALAASSLPSQRTDNNNNNNNNNNNIKTANNNNSSSCNSSPAHAPSQSETTTTSLNTTNCCVVNVIKFEKKEETIGKKDSGDDQNLNSSSSTLTCCSPSLTTMTSENTELKKEDDEEKQQPRLLRSSRRQPKRRSTDGLLYENLFSLLEDEKKQDDSEDDLVFNRRKKRKIKKKINGVEFLETQSSEGDNNIIGFSVDDLIHQFPQNINNNTIYSDNNNNNTIYNDNNSNNNNINNNNNNNDINNNINNNNNNYIDKSLDLKGIKLRGHHTARRTKKQIINNDDSTQDNDNLLEQIASVFLTKIEKPSQNQFYSILQAGLQGVIIDESAHCDQLEEENRLAHCGVRGVFWEPAKEAWCVLLPLTPTGALGSIRRRILSFSVGQWGSFASAKWNAVYERLRRSPIELNAIDFSVRHEISDWVKTNFVLDKDSNDTLYSEFLQNDEVNNKNNNRLVDLLSSLAKALNTNQDEIILDKAATDHQTFFTEKDYSEKLLGVTH